MPDPVDPRGSRLFSLQDRVYMYEVQDGLCTWCGQSLQDDSQADHRIRWADDGPTDVWNGQLLHPECHRQKERVMTNLRQWQTEFLTVFERHGKQHFLLVAPPGVGKTRGCTAAFERWTAKPRRNPLCIGVSPSIQIIRGWAKEVAPLGKTGVIGLNPRERKIETSGGRLDLLPVSVSPPDDLRYWLLTYGSLLSRAKAFDTICQKRDVFVILDEPHHAEGGDDPGAWGKAAATAFDRADKILMPTATPWKTPGTPLPFIDYDDEGQAQADYRVHRWQAIEAGWIRPLNFEYLDADVGWQNVESGDSFSSRVSEKGMLGDKALSTAIRKDDYILDALRRGMSQMEHQHRQGLDTTMIVIADDVMKYHAKQVEKVANREWPSEAVRATGDDPNAHTVIDRFRERKSRARILITVGMAGEGCDIPHLGVLVWLTARRTYLFFVQATGRIIRKSSEEPRAHAAVILPNHPDLLEAAAKLKDEEVPPLRKPEKPGERDWTPPEQQTYESWVDNVHVASFADESRDIKVDSKIDRLATAHHVPTSVVYDILQEKVPPPPPERARKTGDAVAMRERINANLKFYAMNNGRDFPGAHNKAKDKAGIGRGRTLESLTNDELDRLLSASEEMREEATP